MANIKPTTIEKQLHHVRPRIQTFSPIPGWGTLAFGLFNVLLGIALFTFTSTFGGNISILSTIYNYQIWGVLFFANGLLMLYGFTSNDWNLMRSAHVVGMFFKSVWWFALLFRWLMTFGNPALLLVWSILTALQFLIYLYFIPAPKDTS